MEACNKCCFPIHQKDVDESEYETSRVCSCEEDDMLVEFYNAEQAKKTPEEIEKEIKDWDECSKYIMKHKISPNLDSIY